MGIEHRASCKHIFCPNTPRPFGGVKWSFTGSSHVAYQIKWNGT